MALPSSKWLSNRVSFVDHSFTPGVTGSGHSSTEIQTLTENVSTVFCSWAGTLPLSLLRHLLSPNKCQNSTYFNFVEMNANLANIPEIFVSSGLRRPTGKGILCGCQDTESLINGYFRAGCNRGENEESAEYLWHCGGWLCGQRRSPRNSGWDDKLD